MPIFRANSKLVYFAHVPKCAGSSMLRYLRDRFGSVAFHDSIHFLPKKQRWSRTSPQHIDVATLRRMFPEDFFDASFAIVRHPVPRLVSAFQFQREVEKAVAKDMSFGAWLEQAAAEREDNPFIYDNHTRTMDELVPVGATTFHMENGFEPFISWLDELVGDAEGPRSMPKVNERSSSRRNNSEATVPTPAEIKLVADIYARDFDRFGYVPDDFKHVVAPSNQKPAGNSLRGIMRIIERRTGFLNR